MRDKSKLKWKDAYLDDGEIDVRQINGGYGKDLGSVPQKMSEFHAGVAENIIRYWSLPGARIVDPFAGRATRAVVCNKLDRDYYGYEITPNTHKRVLEHFDKLGINPNLYLSDGTTLKETPDNFSDLIFQLLDRPVPGFVSLAGGKYTTYRVMAKDAVDMATNDITKLISDSITSKLPIIGADGYFALAQQVEQLSAQYNLKPETITHLLDRHGSDISDLLALIDQDRKLAAPISRTLPYLKAELVYAVVSEGAQSVSDVLERRTRIWFEAPNFGVDFVNSTADLIAPYLGWKAPQKKASIKDYLDKVAAAEKSAANLVN